MNLDALLWYSIGGVSIAGLLAIAWYIPFLRKYALFGAAVLAGVLTIYRRGQKDANENWNRAIERDVAKGNKARADAERDVAGGVRDKFDRDR